MRLLKCGSGGEFSLTDDRTGDDIPPYAALSHTWAEDYEEVTFKDLMEGTGKSKAGYDKIKFCGRQATKDGLHYFWIDTCCIDKSNSTELQEAINSMFRWYRDATKCYVHLADVSISDSRENAQLPQSTWEPEFRSSRWFTRGWTLQELIAPRSVDFFSREGKRLGDKKSLERQIHEITGVDIGALRGAPLSRYGVQERMSWAAKRQTTRKEDKAYSLLGIFNIYMPIIYGEGENAFFRLQRKIEKSSKGQLETLPISSSTVPFQRDPDFVGRGSLLDQIEQRCAVPGSRTALVGLGGVGKSQLAIEYSYRIRERSPETWVFWVHASNAVRFEQGYRDIAEILKIPGRGDPKAKILKLVHDRLQKPTGSKWILVLDNLDDADFLFDAPSSIQVGQKGGEDITSSQPAVAYLPQSENGSILITTRNRSAALRLAEVSNIIAIEPMASEDAITLLRNKLGKLENNEATAAAELVASLECMPLAIAQAAAYISQRAPRSSVRRYLEEFQKSEGKKVNLLNYEQGQFRRDRETANAIVVTWQISFDRIQMTRSSAADVLSLMSFFDRQGIPEALVRKGTKTRNFDDGSWTGGIGDNGDEAGSSNSNEFDDQFESDILTLRNYSLVSIGVDGTTFEMHALVQLAMRTWLKAQGRLEGWRQQYIKTLSKEFPTGVYENWEKCSSLFPHAKAAIAEEPEGEDSIRQWATLLYNVAWYAWGRGLLADAEDMSVKSMKVRRNLLGLEHPETLSSMALVGLVYMLNGRWKEAEELEVQVVKTRKKLLGVEHPTTLTSMGNLASTYRNQGRWKEAEDLFVQVMETSSRVLGPEHPDTLTSMANLASTYRNQGRWKQAEETEVQVMEGFMRVLGLEHPDTLTSIASLASTYRNQGRWKEAEELFARAMEASLRVLGPEHPDTLTSMASLASTFRNQGRWREAEELEVQVMKTSMKVLGSEHPDTLASMANLSSTLWNQGRWKELEELDTQVMETSRRVLGTEHPSTLTSMANLASTYADQGQWKEAEELYVQVMETSKKVLGAEHPHTLASMSNLAEVYRNESRWKEAEELGVKVLETRQRILGLEHPDTLASMSNLAAAYRNESRWKEAEELWVQVLETRQRILGLEHPATLTSMSNLAAAYGNESRWKEAEELGVQVLETRQRILGLEHPATLTSMANLASTYGNQRQWKEAEELYVQVMETSKKVLGVEHLDTLTSMNNLASTLKGDGRVAEAISLMEECVRLRTSVLGVDHPQTLSSVALLRSWQERDLEPTASSV